MRIRRPLAALAAALPFAALAVGCPREVGGGPPAPAGPPLVPGVLNGPCTDDGFCNDDLLCVDDVCLPPPGGEGEGEGEGEGDPGCPDGDDDGACDDDDCAPADPSVHPDAEERCDDVDSNCDGRTNDALDCTFLAHDSDTTYAVDPFARTVRVLGDIDTTDSGGLLDVDRDVDGKLLAVTSSGVWEILPGGDLRIVASVTAPTRTNGMAITDEGVLFLTNDDGADSAAWRVERSAGTAGTVVRVGGFSAGLVSSGDCVFTKDGNLLMSAKDPDAPTADDVLVLIDQATGATTLRGSLGHPRVFGLSDAFGRLFGVTRAGEVLEIDPATGASTVRFTTDPPVAFAGAANGGL